MTTLSSRRSAKVLLVLALCATLPLASSIKPTASAGVPAAVGGLAAVKNARFSFIANQGQWDSRAQFFAGGPGMNLWITDEGAVFDFYKVDSPQRPTPNALHRAKRKGHVVRMDFVGGRPSSVVGEGRVQGDYNYFIGNDESKWASNVPRFAEAWSERVYDGVEARWYFDQGSPRYDLVVAPGANPNQIAMRYSGADGVGSNGKELILETNLGRIEHRGLFAYQKVNGGTKQVPCRMNVTGNVVRFDVGAYDNTKPLVIDPLIWSTFIGGTTTNSSEQISAIERDSAGNIAFSGFTAAVDFPTTPGAFDETNGFFNAVVGSVTPDGSALNWCTLVGGSSIDGANTLDLTTEDEPIISGQCNSDNFPVTAGAFDTTYNGSGDIFVTKLDRKGSALVYSTFVGGNVAEASVDSVILPDGDVVICGFTDSSNFPLTPAEGSTYGGFRDGVLFRLSSTGASLTFSTFLGGSKEDVARGVAYDGDANIATVLTTESTDIPMTAGVFNTTHNGGKDFAIFKLPVTGRSISAATYLGGTSDDSGSRIIFDSLGRVVVSGFSGSTNFPVTSSAFDKTLGGPQDITISLLSSDLKELVASTFIGGPGDERARALDKDSFGNIVVVGATTASGFPTTAATHDSTFGGVVDGTLSKFSPDLSKLYYSTFLGGTATDDPFALAFDPAGHALVGGKTFSADFPTTPGVFDETLNGNDDTFLTKLNIMPQLLSFETQNTKVIGGFQVRVTIKLSQPAIPGGTPVNLTTNAPGKVFVPPSVLVKAGQSNRSLGVRTETVLTDTAVTLFANCNGVIDAINLTLKPGGLQSLKLTGNAIGKFEFGQGHVNVSAPVPAKVERIVALRSRNPLALWVPDTVVVRETFSSAGFPIYGLGVLTQTNVTVEGKLGSMTKTDTITVTP